jgi:hypothetical protein
MKRAVSAGALAVMFAATASCAAPSASLAPPTAAPAFLRTETPAPEPTPAPTTAQDAVAAASPDELRAMIERYKDEGDREMVYTAALRLTELDPADASAYTDAAEALLALSKANFDEINRLLALGCEKAKQDAGAIAAWAEHNQPDLSLKVPFVPDYAAADEINADGITAGNQTSAGKYGGEWHGGLLTWQGGWVYLARPDEKFAIYKMRADGSDYQRLGQDGGSSLNVVGDWLYYCNVNDGGKPYKMRTDGSMRTKICDDSCGFLSVSGDWVYYDSDCLYKIRTDGSRRTKLNDKTTIFSCVAGGWVYYCVKSAEGGLWRVPADGGKPQKVAKGFILNYCVADGWVYYADANKPNGVQRVRADGTGNEMLFPLDAPVTALNVAGGVLSFSFGVSHEEDGFTVGQEIVTHDLATLSKQLHIEADTEPLCTGPDGWVYFLKYGEGMKWYAMDKTGAIHKIGS